MPGLRMADFINTTWIVNFVWSEELRHRTSSPESYLSGQQESSFAKDH
jgi:hypothetical protein